jgi:hypothetical protein
MGRGFWGLVQSSREHSSDHEHTKEHETVRAGSPRQFFMTIHDSFYPLFVPSLGIAIFGILL